LPRLHTRMIKPLRHRRLPKEPISPSERAYFRTPKSLFRILKEPIWEGEIGSFGKTNVSRETTTRMLQEYNRFFIILA